MVKNILSVMAVIAITLTTVVPADARIGVGPGRRGVGVGRPGAYGVGGYGRVGRVGRPVGGVYRRPVVVRPTPFRPFVGPVIR